MKILVRGCPAVRPDSPFGHAPAGAMGQMPPMCASPRLISREVEDGGSGLEPGGVLDGAAVAQTPVAAGARAGDSAFDWRPPAAVVGMPARIGGSLTAGGCLENWTRTRRRRAA